MKRLFAKTIIFLAFFLPILFLPTLLNAQAEEIRAWGGNWQGQLGNGTNTDSNVPVQVSGLTNIIAIAGGDLHSLALRGDGTVWAWGYNLYGQLGNGTNTNSNVPVQVLNLTNVIAIAGGALHSLALRGDGTVWAWGSNWAGQLGNGTNTDSNVPVQVLNLTNVIAIAGGGSHSLALRSDGTVWAWGWNWHGQLGNGTNTSSNVPVQVSGLTNIIAIAGGWDHSLALRSDGTVWAWGRNAEGQLGNGTNTDSNVPVQVSNLTNVIAIAGGAWHSLALRSDGTVWAWGRNAEGQLGNGTNTDSNVPVQVSNLTNVITIEGGNYHSLALRNDGTVWTWGWNIVGQLGNGTNTDSNVPVQVIDPNSPSGYLEGIIAISGGGYHCLAIFYPCTLSCSASASPTQGIAPLTVNFTALAETSGACIGTPTFSWQFGDGETSSEQNPTHIYQNPGTYNWTLTVSVDGETCTQSGTIRVFDVYPPINISLKREINRSLFRKEAYHTITWSENPENKYVTISSYKIYRKLQSESDDKYKLIATVPSNTFKYTDGRLDPKAKFHYALTSVESGGKESKKSNPVGN